MKISELIQKLQQLPPESEIFVENSIEDEGLEGTFIDTTYHEVGIIEPWDAENHETHFILYCGEVVSG